MLNSSVLIGNLSGNINAVFGISNLYDAIRILDIAKNTDIRCEELAITSFNIRSILNADFSIASRCLRRSCVKHNIAILLIDRSIIKLNAAAGIINRNIIDLQEEVRLVLNINLRIAHCSHLASTDTFKIAAGNIDVATGYSQVFQLNRRHGACIFCNHEIAIGLIAQAQSYELRLNSLQLGSVLAGGISAFVGLHDCGQLIKAS